MWTYFRVFNLSHLSRTWSMWKWVSSWRMVGDTRGLEVFFRHQLFPIRFQLYTQRFSLFSFYILDRVIDSGIGFRICSNNQLCFNNPVTVITDTTTCTKVTTIVSSNSRNKIVWKVLIHLLYPALFDIFYVVLHIIRTMCSHQTIVQKDTLAMLAILAHPSTFLNLTLQILLRVQGERYNAPFNSWSPQQKPLYNQKLWCDRFTGRNYPKQVS